MPAAQAEPQTATRHPQPYSDIIKANKQFLAGRAQLAVNWLVMSSLRRAFSQVHLKVSLAPDVPFPGPQLDRPAIFYVNHSTWWDGYIAHLVLNKTLKMDGYLMMDVRQMRKYFFFAWLGVFSVDRFNPRSALQSINYAAELLQAQTSPTRALWIFPQGEIQGHTRRPLDFYSGAAQVARKLNHCYMYPVALQYQFMTNQFPDIFVNIGPGHRVDEPNRPDAKTLTATMQARVVAELDQIAASINAARFGDLAAERRSFFGYKTIMQGKGSANNRFEKIFGLFLPKNKLC